MYNKLYKHINHAAETDLQSGGTLNEIKCNDNEISVHSPCLSGSWMRTK